ncbi:hypothetical protein H105_05203 [Trichophyton soudanense CBS 452.61]|uniref:Uncharacterized protein n=1 Tax=Trichophyton soudanense CBS 452.61 TaxID=1215331 RepID=A0A022XQY9_TRISD|nr:hypothetical protein H105_05203 [Trichophyton soudanense CBS 452.61]EZG05285.1 hypothetical protein H106_05023 [Trichophyton rubrum CBS 735.88]
MDEFAQTRGVDDLFDDDVIPVASQPQPVHEPVDEPDTAPYSSTQPKEEPIDSAGPPSQVEQALHPKQDAAPSQHRKRGGAGRGRGRGNGFSRKLRPDTPKTPEKSGGSPSAHPAVTETPTQDQPLNGDADAQEKQPEKGQSADASKVDKNIGSTVDVPQEAEQAKETASPRVPAVRGDRSRTGGIRKPKLTEEELSERMAAAKLTAAKKAAAHARAEADEASFQEREKIALAKRLEEQQNRRVMLSEREKNRQRKLNSQTGREWDAEKSQDSFSEHSRGGSAYRRGAHGSIANDKRATTPPTSAGDYDNQPSPLFGDRGRGRGSRGGRGQGRRGVGRGRVLGDRNTEVSPPEQQAKVPTSDEFPALPGSEKQADTKGERTGATAWDKAPDILSTKEPSGTWADQVEISEELERVTTK